MRAREFAVYKGDSFLFIGTAQECAEKLGIKTKSFMFYLTPTYQRRLEKRTNTVNYMVVIALDDEHQNL